MRVSPRRRTELSEYDALRSSPAPPRGIQGSSASRCQSYRPDARVGVRSALAHAIVLEDIEAARQRRLVDGERVLELLQRGLAQALEGRENAELRDPQTTRTQGVIVQLGHGPANMRSVVQTQDDRRPRFGPIVSLVICRLMHIILSAIFVPGRHLHVHTLYSSESPERASCWLGPTS